jgi:hypothetical protein
LKKYIPSTHVLMVDWLVKGVASWFNDVSFKSLHLLPCLKFGSKLSVS